MCSICEAQKYPHADLSIQFKNRRASSAFATKHLCTFANGMIRLYELGEKTRANLSNCIVGRIFVADVNWHQTGGCVENKTHFGNAFGSSQIQ